MTLSDIRKDKRLTQEQLAEKLGISQSAIAMWETGKAVPSTKNLLSISKALEIDISVLVDMLKIQGA